MYVSVYGGNGVMSVRSVICCNHAWWGVGRMCGLLRLEHELELLLKITGSGLRQKLDDLVVYLDRLQGQAQQQRHNTSGMYIYDTTITAC